MRHLWLLVGLLTLIGSGAAQAASYLDIYGTVHDPIQNTYGGDSAYSGDNLEPGASLTGAYLLYADLTNADLTDADLSHAYLSNADLSDANLTGADFTNAILLWGTTLNNANLTGAYFTNAELLSADLTGSDGWSTATWTGATYSTNAVDNSGNPIADTLFPTGMDQAWRDAAGMVAVPEPTTALLLGLGLVGLSARRRS